MLFRYCVPKAVSSTEFYPIPYYESVYLENQCFTIEADSQYQADEKAYRFLANLQKKHDLAYEKLLDEQGIRFVKERKSLSVVRFIWEIFEGPEIWILSEVKKIPKFGMNIVWTSITGKQSSLKTSKSQATAMNRIRREANTVSSGS